MLVSFIWYIKTVAISSTLWEGQVGLCAVGVEEVSLARLLGFRDGRITYSALKPSLISSSPVMLPLGVVLGQYVCCYFRISQT